MINKFLNRIRKFSQNKPESIGTGINSAAVDLIGCYRTSPEPSYKVSNYFDIYADLFKHLRGTNCVFIEVGLLHGGSLFMWRKWLGNRARIIGIDLNPECKKWEKNGFEIYIGDQGDSEFWKSTFAKIGKFDALLDDGGHRSFQQIVTLSEALKAAQGQCVIAIEDTITSFLKSYTKNSQHSFLEYAKDSTDLLVSRLSHFFPQQFPTIKNPRIVNLFSSVNSIEFFPGIVAYKIKSIPSDRPELIWNRNPDQLVNSTLSYSENSDSSALPEWPDPFSDDSVLKNK
jgi:hypothetical protein